MHEHRCPKCRNHFDCPIGDECKDVKEMMCDLCRAGVDLNTEGVNQ